MSTTAIVITVVVLAAIGIWAYSTYKKQSVKTVVKEVASDIDEAFEKVVDLAVAEFKETTAKAKTAPKKAVVKKAPVKKVAPKKVANKAAVVKVAKKSTKKKD